MRLAKPTCIKSSRRRSASTDVEPEEVRRRIERLLPGPYLELYGRKQVEGWCVWGNEVVAPLKAPPRAGSEDNLSMPPFLRRTAP